MVHLTFRNLEGEVAMKKYQVFRCQACPERSRRARHEARVQEREMFVNMPADCKI